MPHVPVKLLSTIVLGCVASAGHITVSNSIILVAAKNLYCTQHQRDRDEYSRSKTKLQYFCSSKGKTK